ncbi:MAG: Arc family DNA-binding protein [Pseudorhizobium sp.]
MSTKGAKEKSAHDLVGLQLRFREELRSRLADAARDNARSLNAEIVDRLDKSLDQEDRAFGPQTYALLQAIADELNRIGQITGKDWFADKETNRASSLIVSDIIQAQYLPKAPNLQAFVDLNRKRLPKRERVLELIKELVDCRVISRPEINSAKWVAKLDVVELPERKWVSTEYDLRRADLDDAERNTLREKLSQLNVLLSELRDLDAVEQELLRPQREAAERGEALYAAIVAARGLDRVGGA